MGTCCALKGGSRAAGGENVLVPGYFNYSFSRVSLIFHIFFQFYDFSTLMVFSIEDVSGRKIDLVAGRRKKIISSLGKNYNGYNKIYCTVI